MQTLRSGAVLVLCATAAPAQQADPLPVTGPTDPAAGILSTELIYEAKDLFDSFRGRYVGLGDNGGAAYNFLDCDGETRRLVAPTDVALDLNSQVCDASGSIGTVTTLDLAVPRDVRIVAADTTTLLDCLGGPSGLPAQMVREGESRAILSGGATGPGSALTGFLVRPPGEPDAARGGVVLPADGTRLAYENGELTATLSPGACPEGVETWATNDLEIPQVAIPDLGVPILDGLAPPT